MKIGFFTDSYLPMLDGVSTSVESCARALEEKGHEVYIIAPRYPRYKDKRKNVYRLISIKVVRTPEIRFALQLPEKSLLQILQIDFDIIHGHSGGGVTFLGLQIARAKNIPYIATYHTLWNRYAHYMFRGVVIRPRMLEMTSRFFGNLCDALIAPTKRVKRELTSYNITKPIYVLPNGIRTQDYKNIKPGFLRKKAHIAKGTKVLLYVGRLGEEKSVDFLIRSFQLIHAKDPKTALVLLGTGPDKDKLKDIAKRLDIAQAVYFVGTVRHSNIPKVYADADLFVFASQTETQGMVILEAFASGVPVVAVKDEAFSGVIEDDKNGYLVEKDRKIFAEKASAILGNQNLSEKFSQYAKQTAEKYSIEKTVTYLEGEYKKLIKRKGEKRRTITSIKQNLETMKTFFSKAKAQIREYQ
jgi:1,2-diacylglycerol 3-alpha-glucosyltransferase